MAVRAVAQARNIIVLLIAALTLGAAISLYANLRSIESQYTDLARLVGRTTVEALVATRDWNMRHQGVYVPVTPGVTPDVYLVDPLREVMTTQGMELTKINHAEMTRMIAELLDKEQGLHVHLTSLTPIRPLNAPDPWEKSALLQFPDGRQEAFGLQNTPPYNDWFRYMAPLKAERSCITCHHEHKSESEIRGGISVSFSFLPFQKLQDQARSRIWLWHILGLTASLIPIVFLGGKLTRTVDALQSSLLRVRQLEGLVPICSSCKKIRTEGADADAQGSWVPVELYISERTAAEFSHGLCPECREKLYPELNSHRKLETTRDRKRL